MSKSGKPELSSWAQIPCDILNNIAKLLRDGDSCSVAVPVIHDIRLRSVCTVWRNCISAPPRYESISLPFPIGPDPNLSPGSNISPNPNIAAYFNVSYSTTYLLRYQPPPHRSSTFSSSSSPTPLYWLLRIEEKPLNNDHTSYRMLNPLFRLPSDFSNLFPGAFDIRNSSFFPINVAFSFRFVSTSKTDLQSDDLESYLPTKVALSTSAPFCAMVIFQSKLWFFKFGEVNWTPIDVEEDSMFEDLIFHKGNFYAVDIYGKLVSINPSGSRHTLVRESFYFDTDFYRLVSTESGMYLVIKILGPEETEHEVDFAVDHAVVHLRVFKLNEEGFQWQWKWERMNDIGGYIFFVGDEFSYSIDPTVYPGLDRGCGDSVFYCENSFLDYNELGVGKFYGDIGVQTMHDRRCGPIADFSTHRHLIGALPAWL